MLISIHDKTLQRVAFLDNEKPGALHFFNDKWHRYLTEATSTFDFSVPKTGNADTQYLTDKNYISFRYEGEDYLFNIMRTEETEEELTCYCENLSLELLNEDAAAYEASGAKTFVQYFNDSSQIGGQSFTDLIIGINEVSEYTRTLSWEGTSTKLARLLSLVNKFDAECEFVTELNRDGTLKRVVINVYKQHDDDHQGVGTRRNDVTLYYGKTIDSIRRTVDKTDLCSAIYPTGKDGLTVTSLTKTEYDDKGRVLYNTPAGSPHIYAPQTAEQYPAQLSSNDDPWILHRWDYDTDNVNTLYGQALAELKKRSVPALTYEIQGFFELNIGDTVTIYDDKFTPTLLLQARVSEQEVSFCDPSKNKNTFSNFKALENRLSTDITSRLNQLVQDAIPYTAEILTDNGTVFKNGEGETNLTARVLKSTTDMTGQVALQWARDGTDLSTSPTITITADDILGTAVYRLTVKNGSGTELCFAEVTIINVDDGAGINHVDVEYCQSTSNTNAPTGPWETEAPPWEDGKYIWTRTVITYGDGSTTTTDPVCISGEQGADGVSLTAIQEQYYLSTSDTTQTGGSWAITCPDWVEGKYIWTRSKCSWSNSTVTYTTPVLAQGLNTANATASNAKDTAVTADIKAGAALDAAEVASLQVGELTTSVANIGLAVINKADINLANIELGCIKTAMIDDAAIGTTQIADGSITDGKILSLTANKITAGTIDAGVITVVNLNAANITVGQINGNQIAGGAVDMTKLGTDVSGAISYAQTTANGKNTVFYQSTAPTATGRRINDVWFDTDDDNKMYYWAGSAWAPRLFGTNSIENMAITNALISNLDAAKITTGVLNAARIGSNSIESGHIKANAITTDKLSVGAGGNLYNLGYDDFEHIPNDPARICYNKINTVTVSIDTSTCYIGTRCLKLVANASVTDGWVFIGDAEKGHGCIPVIAGQIYIASVWVKSSSSSNVDFYIAHHAARTPTSGHTTAKENVTVGTSWTRIFVRFTALAAYPYVSIRIDNDTPSTSLWVDAIQIERGTATQEPSEFKSAGTTSINGANIYTNTITANQIAANAITSAKIAGEQILANHIKADQIQAGHIKAGAITAGKLDAGAVAVGNISDAAIASINALIEVGGVNLAVGSSVADRAKWHTTGWSGNLSAALGYADHCYLLKMGGGWSTMAYNYKTLVGKQVTIQADVLLDSAHNVSDSAGLKVMVGRRHVTSTSVITNETTYVIKETNKWTHVEAIVTLTADYPYPVFYFRGTTSDASTNSCWVYIKDVKIESGNKATDWSPAPEDTDASIATNSIANWCYNNNLTYIDGGKIYAKTVTADQIAANAITAEKFYGKAIQSENYVANSTGMKINLANGVIDSKNFKVASDGKVTVSGDLNLIGANRYISVKTTGGTEVGKINFVDLPGQTWSPGAVGIHAKDWLALSAGSGSGKSFIEFNIGGRNFGTFSYTDSANYGVMLGEPMRSINIHTGSSPNVFAQGATQTQTLSLASGLTTKNNVAAGNTNAPSGTTGRCTAVYNALGRFVTLNIGCTGSITAATWKLVTTLPTTMRPDTEVVLVGYCSTGDCIEVYVEPDGRVWFWNVNKSLSGSIYVSANYYLSKTTN